jgi:serine protease Do
LSEAPQAWALVKDTTDVRALEAFRRQYGAANSFFDRLAEAKIEELKQEENKRAEAERQRQAMLRQRQQEEAARGKMDNYLGLTLVAGNGANKNAVVVDEIDNASDAATKGIKFGDVILEVSGLEVKTPEDVANAAKEAIKLGRKAVLIRVKSGGETRFVALQLKKDR